VIPLHDLRVEHLTAVSAWSVSLEAAEPGPARHCVDRSGPRSNAPTDPSLIHRVTNFCGALPAVDLQSVAIPRAPIEGRVWFHDGAPRASFGSWHVLEPDSTDVLTELQAVSDGGPIGAAAVTRSRPARFASYSAASAARSSVSAVEPWSGNPAAPPDNVIDGRTRPR
jgi:hypothetical protein